MVHLKRVIVGGLVALACLTGSALSADIPEIIEPPVFTPVDDHRDWYLRADAGLSLNGWLGVSPSGKLCAPCFGAMSNEQMANGIMVGVGAGLKINEWLRTDVTLEYRADVDVRGRYSGGAREYADIQAFAGFVNGYVDFGKWEKITPYVGAGVGGSLLRTTQNYQVGACDCVTGRWDKANKFNFAWNVTAGASFKLKKNVELDVNYRFANLGGAVSGQTTFGGGNRVQWNNLVTHDVRAGIRVKLW